MEPSSGVQITTRNQLKVKHKDALNHQNSENFNLNLTVDQIKVKETATQIYNWALGFCSLTSDTYDDCDVIITKNVDSVARGD